MTAAANFPNEFSWSRSRDATFQECRRRYYFQYYGSWGGWNAGVDPRTREIYILKQLKSRQMWAGEVVHRCIQRSLENLRSGIEPLPEDRVIAMTLDQMRLEWSRSRKGVYHAQPKATALFEHEYKVDVADEVWKENAQHVENCLHTFYQSEIFRDLSGLTREDWIEVEDLSNFFLEGTKVFVKLDCACRRDGKTWIYDWKTGRRDDQENSLQLACYALYAQEKWGISPEDLRVLEFHLATDRLMEFQVTSANLKRVREYMLGSIRDMRELWSEDGINQVDGDACSLTEERWRCKNCNYKRLCDR